MVEVGYDPRWQWGSLPPKRAAGLLRERVALLGLLKPLRAPLLLGYVIVTAASVLAPTGLALATAALIGGLRDGRVGSFAPVAAVGALIVLAEAAGVLRSVLTLRITEVVDGAVRSAVRRAAGGETPFAVVASVSFQADVGRACDPGVTARNRTAGAACTGQLLLLFRFLGAGVGAAVLAAFDPWLAAFVLSAALTVRTLIRRQWIHLTRLQADTTPELHEREAVGRLLVEERAGRELRVLRLHDWFIDRWTEIADRHRRRFSVEHLLVVRRQYVTTALAFGIVFAGFGFPAFASASGDLGIARLTACLVAVTVVFEIAAMGFEAFDIDYGMGAFHAYRRIMATTARIRVPGRPVEVDSAAPIRFERVGFAYPGSARRVLDGLDLEIRAGETLGLVGVNGAGKSTLTTLLTGLYAPTTGRITRGDAPYPPPDRPDVAVVNQNFLRYPLSVRENIRLALTDEPTDDDLVLDCLAEVGLADHLRANGITLDDPLWSARGGGRIGLSGGQWQRLALARALFAVAKGSSVVVLDEPTSQLDVDAELSFHDQVLSVLAEATVVLITHRLSTVRHVDRIVLLSDGRITEDGSHERLLAADGTYARLFRVQAQRFGEVRA
ncbi:ATP-binding cassette domain-containing protein [Nocardia takedensis]